MKTISVNQARALRPAVGVCLVLKQPSCEKGVHPPKSPGEKRCEIKGGSQEMTVMVG